jgi:hypothetical protein
MYLGAEDLAAYDRALPWMPLRSVVVKRDEAVQQVELVC